MTLHWRDYSKTFALLLVLLWGQITLDARIQAVDSAYVELPESHERWNADLFRTLSFGHLPAAVDWLLLRFLLDPAYTHVTGNMRAPVFYDLDLATDLDPLFYDLYVVGGSFLAVVRNDGEGARLILEKGEKFRSEQLPLLPEKFRNRFWPAAWQIPLALGYVYIFEKDDLPKGLEVFERTSRIPGAPDYLKRLAERLKVPGAIFQVGLRMLDTMIDSSRNPEARERLFRRRQSLQVAGFLYHLNGQFLEFRQKSPAPLAAAWKRFLVLHGNSRLDPWGGELSISPTGTILTNTPHEKVLGIE